MKLNFSMNFFGPVVLLFAIIYSYVIKSNSLCSSALCQGYELVYWIITIFLISVFFYLQPSSLKVRDKKVWALSGLLFSFLIAFNWENLNANLVSDHIYHAQEALRNFSMLGERFCKQNLAQCAGVPFASVVNFYSRTLAGLFFIVILLLTQTNHRKVFALAAIALFFLLTQFLRHEQIQSGDVHPPLRLAPLWIASAFFGIKMFSFRVVGMIALGLFSFFTIHFFAKKKGVLVAFFTVVIFSTIPILQHVAYIVEPSLWTTLSWTGVLLFITFGKRDSNNFCIWFFILALASLMRASAFVAIIPLGLYWLKFAYDAHGFRFLIRKDFYIPMIPILIMLPFTFKSIAMGTPATGGDTSKLTLMLLSVQSFLSVRVAYYSIMLPWIAFFPLGFLSSGENKIFKFFIKLLFFTLSYIVFYSINQGLWGMSRYQAEFILPFVIVGIFNFLFFLHGRYRKIFNIVLMLFFGYNLWVSWRFQSYSNLRETAIFTGLRDGRSAGISEIVYDTKLALNAVRDRNLLATTYLDGITYGSFPQLMASATFTELEAINVIGNPWGGFPMEDINKNKKINAIILSDWEPGSEKAKKLIDLNWRLVETFENRKYNTKTYLLLRK